MIYAIIYAILGALSVGILIKRGEIMDVAVKDTPGLLCFGLLWPLTILWRVLYMAAESMKDGRIKRFLNKQIVPIVVLSIILSGCALNDNRSGMVVAKVTKSASKDRGCLYNVREQAAATEEVIFYDNCGRFNVGDTVQFVKK